MTITTIGRWINTPTPSGASDPLRADESLDAGTLQILASNCTHAARENNLRTLYEWPGTDALYNGLPGDEPANFPWDQGTSDGRVVLFAGTHRVRLYGETATPPKLRLRARGLASSPYALGVLLVAMPLSGRPELRGGNFVHLTTSSTSLAALSGTVVLSAEMLGTMPLAPVGGTAGGDPDESGTTTRLALYVGIYHTSGSSGSKGQVSGLTIYLESPS